MYLLADEKERNMKTGETTSVVDDKKLCLANELYRTFYISCFWYMKQDLVITPQNLYLVIRGLRLYGGKKGFLLAAQLEDMIIS